MNRDTEPLAMVTPIWEAFPEAEIAAQTSTLIELSMTYPVEDLIKRLKKMASTFLLFLNKLTEISIKITEDKVKRRVTLKRQHAGLEKSNGFESVIVHRNDEAVTYATLRREVSINAHDERRNGCSKSELVLAFPTDSSSKLRHSKAETQFLHAFLPVHNYGLKGWAILHSSIIILLISQSSLSTLTLSLFPVDKVWLHLHGIPRLLMQYLLHSWTA